MTASTASADLALRLPVHRGAYYGGAWHDPASGAFAETLNPSSGKSIGRVAVSGAADVDAAVAAAKRGFVEWRAVAPLERAKILRRIAQLLRENTGELALIDAANCGN
ncbi:MAG: aldehyde dehydrogenase family protein, partial [Betaproteobacteria bacterium]